MPLAVTRSAPLSPSILMAAKTKLLLIIIYCAIVLTKGRKRKQRLYSLFAPLPQQLQITIMCPPITDLSCFICLFIAASYLYLFLTTLNQHHKLENHLSHITWNQLHKLEIIWTTFLLYHLIIIIIITYAVYACCVVFYVTYVLILNFCIISTVC